MSASSESRRTSRSGTTLQSGRSRSFSQLLEPRLLVLGPGLQRAQPDVVVLHGLDRHGVRGADAEDRAHEQLMNQHRPRLDADRLEQRRVARRRALHQKQFARARLWAVRGG